MTKTDEKPDVTLPRLGPWGTVRWVWRQLTSMRTALFLLLLLAVAAVPGSCCPRSGIDAGKVTVYQQQHRTLGPFLNRIGAFSVYSSVWFSAIYLLLFVSLVGCLVPRTVQQLRGLRDPLPRTPARPERLPVSAGSRWSRRPSRPRSTRRLPRWQNCCAAGTIGLPCRRAAEPSRPSAAGSASSATWPSTSPWSACCCPSRPATSGAGAAT